jgi:hypothetical protein
VVREHVVIHDHVLWFQEYCHRERCHNFDERTLVALASRDPTVASANVASHLRRLHPRVACVLRDGWTHGDAMAPRRLPMTLAMLRTFFGREVVQAEAEASGAASNGTTTNGRDDGTARGSAASNDSHGDGDGNGVVASSSHSSAAAAAT